MKTTKYFGLILVLITVFVFAAGITAQSNRITDIRTPNAKRPSVSNPPDNRTAAIRQLGLTREQRQQYRKINVERRPLMDEAQKRLRDASRSLDEAIYGDKVSEADVEARLRAFQAAQAEVARIRFMKEFAIRQILTPEQLIRFREMRRRFERVRRNAENRQSDIRRGPVSSEITVPQRQPTSRLFANQK